MITVDKIESLINDRGFGGDLVRAAAEDILNLLTIDPLVRKADVTDRIYKNVERYRTMGPGIYSEGGVNAMFDLLDCFDGYCHSSLVIPIVGQEDEVQ